MNARGSWQVANEPKKKVTEKINELSLFVSLSAEIVEQKQKRIIVGVEEKSQFNL